MELQEIFLIQFLSVIVYYKNIVGSGAWLCDLPFLFWLVEGGNDINNLTEHRDPHLNKNSVIWVHSYVLMNIASYCWNLPLIILKDNILFLDKPLDCAIIGLVLAVTQLAAIYVTTYCHLWPINQLFGDTRIIWVDLKPYACQTLGELAIVKQTGHHCSI